MFIRSIGNPHGLRVAETIIPSLEFNTQEEAINWIKGLPTVRFVEPYLFFKGPLQEGFQSKESVRIDGQVFLPGVIFLIGKKGIKSFAPEYVQQYQ